MSEVIKTHVEGRYPHQFARLDPNNMTVETSVYEDDVVFRVDDKKNLDFWLQITVTKDQLKEILRQMEEKGE